MLINIIIPGPDRIDAQGVERGWRRGMTAVRHNIGGRRNRLICLAGARNYIDPDPDCQSMVAPIAWPAVYQDASASMAPGSQLMVEADAPVKCSASTSTRQATCSSCRSW